MHTVLNYLIPLSILAVLVVLIFGVFSMAKGGIEDARRSNRLMRLRVLTQAIALALIAIAVLWSRH